MRIAVATWYRENYGSVLQAYATCMLLRAMGHDPIFLKFDFSGGLVTKLRARIKLLGAGRAFSQLATNVRGRVSAHQHADATIARANAMDLFIQKNLVATEREYTRGDYEECLQEADAFLCGSDQIWNPAITCYSPFYWLSFVPVGVPKIAYAPSMGMPKMSDAVKEFVVTQLNSFQDVSVRESATADMLNSLPGLTKCVETVVDPTLLVPKEWWVELCEASRVSQMREPYAFAYILRGTPEQRSFCSRIARSKGLKLVVYPYLEAVPQGKDACDWGDERIFDDDPADFLARIRGASLIITDSFHCTLFSILFHRDFYVLRKAFDAASQRTRIDEILSVAGLEERILEEPTEKRIESDFDSAEARLAVHANSSRGFLENAVARAAARVGRAAGEQHGTNSRLDQGPRQDGAVC